MIDSNRFRAEVSLENIRINWNSEIPLRCDLPGALLFGVIWIVQLDKLMDK